MDRIKIIAEVSWNHCGDMNLAKEMISVAAECGVDYVKFQSWSVNNLKPGEWDNDGRRQIYEKAELSYDDHVMLIDYCNSQKVQFMTSVFSVNDISKIPDNYSSPIKIPSTEINNGSLIDACAKFKTKIVSTGASSFREINDLCDKFNPINNDLILMHCVSCYPCPSEKANLLKILKLKQCLRTPIGYSDHTINNNAAFWAISNEVPYIEKHFTIDQNLPGRDNKFACLPNDMKQICDFRDQVQIMCSNMTYDYLPEENAVREHYRQRWCKNG